MSLVIKDEEVKDYLNAKQGLSSFLSELLDRVDAWGETSGCIIRQPELADELGISLSTVKRNLRELKNLGIITMETKRGNNGGTVLVFNRSKLDFKVVDNPVTSKTKEAQELRDAYFPKKKEPTKRYRSKSDIARARALALVRKNEETTLNDELECLPYPTKDFFNKMDDPELATEAYIISRMFNAYALIFPQERYLFYKDSDKLISNRAIKARDNAFMYDVLGERFVGTPRWNKFLELAKFCKDKEINPLAYLTSQFKYIDYRESIGRPVGPIPFVNTLLTEESQRRYFNDEDFYSGVRRKNPFLAYTGKVLFLGAKYPIIQALHIAYTIGPRDEGSLDHVIEELEWASGNSKEAEALLRYYMTVNVEITASDLKQEHKNAILKFVKEQTVLYSGTTGMSDSDYLLSCTLQLQHMRAIASLNGVSEEHMHFYLGNKEKLSKVTEMEYDKAVSRGELLDFSMSASHSFRETLGMLSEHQSLGVSPHVLHEALQEFGPEKVPLDNFGLLDTTQLNK